MSDFKGTKTPEVLVAELFALVITKPAFRKPDWSEKLSSVVKALENFGDAIGSAERKSLFQNVLNLVNADPKPDFSRDSDNTKLFDAVKPLHDLIFKQHG